MLQYIKLRDQFATDVPTLRSPASTRPLGHLSTTVLTLEVDRLLDEDDWEGTWMLFEEWML